MASTPAVLACCVECFFSSRNSENLFLFRVCMRMQPSQDHQTYSSLRYICGDLHFVHGYSAFSIIHLKVRPLSGPHWRLGISPCRSTIYLPVRCRIYSPEIQSGSSLVLVYLELNPRWWPGLDPFEEVIYRSVHFVMCVLQPLVSKVRIYCCKVSWVQDSVF